MKLSSFILEQEEESAPKTEVPRITTNQAVEMIENSKGKIFDITFRKRTDNTLRKMNARIDPTVGVYWESLPFDAKEKGLLGVQDLKKKAPRLISRESLRSLRIDGKKYLITPEVFEGE